MRALSAAAIAGVLGLLQVALASDARACGGCFHEPTQNGDVITDHRMILRVTPGATTLYDEIEYSGSPQSFAWVLPVHGAVTIGLSADILFSSLDAATETTIEGPLLPACPSCACFSGSSGGGGSGGGSGSSSSGGGGGVVVTGQQTVGPYDTVQLHPTGTNPRALEDWLSANGFAVPADVKPVIGAYVKEGFDFLALKLAPGQGVSAMRPVRVTSPGAGLSLPLRMVAAGTGPTVGITLWVVGDGRYEPSNFQTFTIPVSDLVWDFATQLSNYVTVRAQAEAALGNAAWQIESSLDLFPNQIEEPVLGASAGANYLPVPAGDGGADAGAGKTAAQVRQDDLDVLFPAGSAPGTVRVTRMRADLARAALAADLTLSAPGDQSTLSNVYPVTRTMNAPTCAPVSNCPPCGGSGSGGSSGGAGGSSGAASSSGGGASEGPGGHGSGCSTTPDAAAGGGLELGFAALLGAALLGGPRLRRRRERGTSSRLS